MPNGRFAPSPTGEFHLGNLRTALLAWALARTSRRGFVLRMEDLDDRSRPEFARLQIETLEDLGVTWDGPILWQHERTAVYRDIAADLSSRGLLYECYCTRRDLAQAPSAPHQPPGSYPGTCRNLTEIERAKRRERLTNRSPALRLAADRTELAVTDALAGPYTGAVDDLVIQRGDGVFSYNFTSVVDDAEQNVSQIVRGDDLLPSTPRQVYLQGLLGVMTPEYAHVPLVLNREGVRLAKRDGAVTASALAAFGWTMPDIVELLGMSLGMDHPRSAEEFAAQLPGTNVARGPWLLDVDSLRSGPRTVLGS